MPNPSHTFYTNRGPRVFWMLGLGYLILFAPFVGLLIDPAGAELPEGKGKYFALAATASVSSAGPKEQITDLEVQAGGGSVQLELSTGEVFYLTPAQPQAFCEAARQFLP